MVAAAKEGGSEYRVKYETVEPYTFGYITGETCLEYQKRRSKESEHLAMQACMIVKRLMEAGYRDFEVAFAAIVYAQPPSCSLARQCIRVGVGMYSPTNPM